MASGRSSCPPLMGQQLHSSRKQQQQQQQQQQQLSAFLRQRAPRSKQWRALLVAAIFSAAFVAAIVVNTAGTVLFTAGAATSATPRWQPLQNLVPRKVCPGRRGLGSLGRRCSSSDDEQVVAAPEREIRWLPPLDDAMHGETNEEPSPDVTVLPLFPLAAYLPHSQHVLNIFEPRYRQLYNDILFSGGRRFVVVAVDPETERFAETGVVFYLEDLSEVSEQTKDQFKYICSHKVIGRVRLGRITNPTSWLDRSTYLKVHTTPIEDTDPDDDFSDVEEQVMETFKSVIDLQSETEELVRFNASLGAQFNATRAEHGGLWNLMNVWLDLYSGKAQAKQKVIEKDMEERLKAYRASNPEMQFESPEFQELLNSLRAELHNRYNEEVVYLHKARSILAQRLLQSTSHTERVRIAQSEFDSEQSRLRAVKVIRGAVKNG